MVLASQRTGSVQIIKNSWLIKLSEMTGVHYEVLHERTNAMFVNKNFLVIRNGVIDNYLWAIQIEVSAKFSNAGIRNT